MNKVSKYPKITVVTPNFNQGDFIEQTICSVLDQGYPNLEYIIIDGGSTDNSVSVIQKYKEQLQYWISEKDAGMYDAINKGFKRATGDIMCWINSDDVLWPGSLKYVATTFKKNKNLHWLQGYPSVVDEEGVLLYQREPIANLQYFLLKAYHKECAFIQQESTFWSRDLWLRTGGTLNTTFRVAADFDLWMRFFAIENLYCTKQQLAAFRKREGQKSENITLYLQEADTSVLLHMKEVSILKKINWKLLSKTKRIKLSKTISWI